MFTTVFEICYLSPKIQFLHLSAFLCGDNNRARFLGTGRWDKEVLKWALFVPFLLFINKLMFNNLFGNINFDRVCKFLKVYIT